MCCKTKALDEILPHLVRCIEKLPHSFLRMPVILAKSKISQFLEGTFTSNRLDENPTVIFRDNIKFCLGPVVCRKSLFALAISHSNLSS